ncbi:MAG: hypothetical protein EPO11_08795 [Gammaproteobacteria bacterium]|nr:MAG: hypothetical protein EPO11_08795 [Gammaproteobacteria bacterium]
MPINTLLYAELMNLCPEIHVTRLQALMDVATGLQHSKRFTIFDIGRHLQSGAELKHRIKKVDRLFGNKHLYSELADVYEGLSQYVF